MIQPFCFPYLSRRLPLGLLVCALLSSAVPHASGKSHGDGTGPAKSGPTTEACHGFIVLPNGLAVLSGPPEAPPAGSAAHAHSGAGPAGTTSTARSHMAMAPAHLMGYTHGQSIVPQPGMLCVPLGTASARTWTTVGPPTAPTVTVESRQGALSPASHAATGLTLIVQRQGQPVETAQVRLLVRMPHHDRRMPGGHGPANDPEVQGLLAQADGPGRYTVPVLDFTMGGPWLFEIQVQYEAELHKVYFAAQVGEP